MSRPPSPDDSSPGDNPLVATARRGTDTATDSVTVRYEKPPTIFILHPRNGARVREAASDVSGFVDDPSAAVSVNGVTATVDEAGGFVARSVPLALGPNTLVAQAVALDGGVGTDSVVVTRDDALAPLLRLVLYDPGAPLIADDFGPFRDLLAQRGLAPEQFSPPVSRITVGGGTRQVYLYVFAEEGGSVTIPEVAAFGADPTQELLPISALPDFQVAAGLDPTIVPQLVPLDFEPRFFQVYLLNLQTNEGR